MLLFSKKRLVWIGFILISSVLRAQTADQKPVFIGLKNEIDLHFPILGISYNYGASLLYKRQIGRSVQKKWLRRAAFRVSVGAGVDHYDSNFSHNFRDSLITDLSKGTERTQTGHLGFEAQFKKGRFEHWWAIDAGVRRFNSSGTHTSKIVDGSTPLPDRVTDWKDSGFGLGLSPIWGFRFFLSPRFSMGMEFIFPIEGEFTKFNSTTNGTVVRSNDFIWAAGYKPPRFLFIGYHF